LFPWEIERPLFHYKNHPIKWVRVTGVVVAVDEYPGKNVYTVDDSSGMCVECVCVAPMPTPKDLAIEIPAHLNQLATIHQASTSTSETKKVASSEGENGKGKEGKEKTAPSVQEPIVPWAGMDVGVVVKVKGRVGDYWKQKQVEVVKVEVLRSTDAEVKCWNEVMDFRRDVLEKVWVVTKEEEEKFRKIRERELRGRGKGVGKDKEEKRKEEREEARRKRKEMEREESDAKRKKERDETLRAKNKVNYPSLAVRRAAAGKYDALGI
jgi:Telomere regulation protein Stn1